MLILTLIFLIKQMRAGERHGSWGGGDGNVVGPSGSGDGGGGGATGGEVSGREAVRWEVARWEAARWEAS